MGRSAISTLRRRAKIHPNGPTADFMEQFDKINNCFWCENPVVYKSKHRSKMKTLDHIIPDSQHGGCRINNLVVSCGHCNNERGDIDFIEYGIMKILASTYPDRYDYHKSLAEKLRINRERTNV